MSITTVSDASAAGALTAAQPTAGTPVAGGTVALTLGGGQASWNVDLRGTFSGGTTVLFEGTVDGTNWLPATATQLGSTAATPATSVAGGAAIAFGGTASGLAAVRVRASALAGGDNVTVTLRASRGASTGGSSGGGAGGVQGAATIADGADVTLGAKADAALTDATATGSLMAFTKGLVKILADVWSSARHVLKAEISSAQWVPLGYVQYTMPGDTAHTLADIAGGIPAGSNRVIIKMETGNLRLVLDGSTPSQTVGTLYETGIFWVFAQDLTKIKFANAVAGTNALLNLEFGA